MYPPNHVHVHTLRLASGEEALVARVSTPEGRVGYGFSLRLDATEARHMAEWHAGVRKDRPAFATPGNHPWEKAWAARAAIQWSEEPGFSAISWQPC